MSSDAEDPAPDLWHPDRNVHFIPIRHHSPACAKHLMAAIDEIGPAEILIEGPEDYQPLIELITDEVTSPPVAIVSFPSAKGGKTDFHMTSYYPLCSHSPEFVALAQAAKRGVPAQFIDLPSGDRMMLRGARDEDEEPEPMSLTDERAFDSSDYVRALAVRLGCRDQNEVWDHLFETRLTDPDWRRFFSDVGAYCHHVRMASAERDMERDGTIAREANMAAWIRDRLAAAAGPIVVLTGGFHTPALIDLVLGNAAPPVRSKKPQAADAYLIRYGFKQLDLLNGYGAGMPRPGYYDRIWRCHLDEARDGDPWRTVALDVLSEFTEHLRQSKAWPAPPVPTVSAAYEAAIQLARLRGRPGPTREDLLDACRSTLMTGEEIGDAAPTLGELGAFLTGSKLGDVPPSAGSPPLVEAARAEARRNRLNLEDGEARNRELDIYRNPAHRTASRFFHAMAFLDTGFGRRTGGPDLLSGVNLDILFESWSYAWSPMVEARLIDLAGAAENVTEACVVEMRKRLKSLTEEGQGRNAGAVVDLFIMACQAGIHDPALRFLPLLSDEVVSDPDFSSVVAALQKINLLWHGRDVMELPNAEDVEHLIGVAYRRALYLMADLKTVREDRMSDALEGLANLREVIVTCETEAVDRDLFTEAVGALMNEDLHPTLAGAVAALAYLSDLLTKGGLVERMKGSLSGAYVDIADRVAFLRGVMAISRELIWRVPGLVAEMDAILGGLDDEEFITLLPHLRLAFAGLDPRETDKLALTIADRHGISAQSLAAPVSYDLTAEEMQRNLELSTELARQLAEDGLSAFADPAAETSAGRP